MLELGITRKMYTGIRYKNEHVVKSCINLHDF